MPARRPLMLLVLMLAAAPSLVHAWQAAIPDTPAASRPFGVAVDAAGDVLVAGRAVVSSTDDDGVLAKLAGGDGTVVWQSTFAGSANGSDLLRAVAADPARGVVACGQVLNSATAGDMLVVRTDAAGVLQWRQEIDGGANATDDALAIAADADGAALVVGQMTPAASSARFTVLKLAAADGTTTWHTELGDGSGTGRAVARAGASVYVAGNAGGKIVVAKLADDDGSEAWHANLTGSADGAHVGRAVAVGAGQVVVAGHLVSPSRGPEFAVLALDEATGAERWRYTRDGTATGAADTDDAFDVAVDADGDVVAAGRLANVITGEDGLVVKLAADTGAERSRATFLGNSTAANKNDIAQAIALDGDDVFVTGSVRDSGASDDVLLARLSGATGAEEWRLALNGAQGGADAGFAIAASNGDLVAATRFRNGTSVGSIAVMKRTGTNGGNFPCGNGHLDVGEACDDGNVVAGDGCRADCTVEVCGDGIRDPGEGCDDGNHAAGDCCSPTCTVDADQTPCDDGDACTLSDHCSRGACVAGSAVVCQPTDPCDRALCDPDAGTCTHQRASDGAPCDDGSACTILDQCINETCTGSGAPSCVDDDPCTADACLPASGCAFPRVTGVASLTCLFDRTTITSGCPGGLPRSISSCLDRAKRRATAAATGRPSKTRRALNDARKALKQATHKAEVGRRRGKIDEECSAALAQALGDMLSADEGLRAPSAVERWR